MPSKSSMFLLAATALALGGLVLGEGREAKADDQIEFELAAVCIDELCGYVDSQGQWRIPPRFRAADPFARDGRAWVIYYDEKATGPDYTGGLGQESKGGKYAPRSWPGGKVFAETPYGGRFGLINSRGEFVDPEAEADQGPAPGLTETLSPQGPAAEGRDRNGGYINTAGLWVDEPGLNRVGRFVEGGLAAAQINLGWAPVREPGLETTPPKFEPAVRFEDGGLALAGPKNRLTDWVNYREPPAQSIASPKETGPPDPTPRPRRRNEVMGYVDADGEWLIKPIFDEARSFAPNGLAAVSIDRNWGYIDTEGQWAIELQFAKAQDFGAGGLAAAAMGRKYGLINFRGQWVIEPRFDRVWPFGLEEQGLARVEINGRQGLLDARGHWLVEPIFYEFGWPGRSSDLVKASAPAPWPEVSSISCYLDLKGGLYRTGLADCIDEPGFHWELVEGGKNLLNRQGEIIVSIEKNGGQTVAKNAAGEVIWPAPEGER